MRAPRRGPGPAGPLSLLLPCLLAALCAAPAWATKITFRYQPVIGGVNSVSVAGSFNGWDAKANPLLDADKDGVYEAVLDLPKGRIEYKFVVNGDQYFADDNAEDFAPDGFGAQNSVLTVKDKPETVGHGATVKRVDAAATGLHRVPFQFKPPGHPDKVCVAGAFNDWSIGKTPMSDPDGDGTWTTTVLLAPGSYAYKFVVGDNGWTQDTAGEDSSVDDGFGGKNSIRNVDERFPKIETKAGDGAIFPDGVVHEQNASEVNDLGGGRVELTARAHRGDVDGVDLVAWPAGAEQVTPMARTVSDKIYDYYRATVTMPAGETRYLFRYRDGKLVQYLGAKGLGASADSGRFTYSEARFPPFVTPDWVKNGIVYQIYPDRFRNGSTANDPDFHEWYYEGKRDPPASGMLDTDFQEYYHLVRDWSDYGALTKCKWTKDGRDWMAFYGGDLEGVRQSLDYLQDLGVTVIYFNPIFEAKSTHKYDAADYRKIDPHFGTNDEFKAFVAEAHRRGIRIVLDIVYNHSGNSHWAFRDAVQNGPKSPYYQWYDFKQWPLPAGWPSVPRAWKPADYYACWWGFGDLPDLNFDLAHADGPENGIRDIAQAQPNIGLIQYLLDSTEYWLKVADADGVRLDVPNEVPFWFWKLFNARVKKVKPDAWIVGELWGNATEHVRPGVFDAVMNYAYFRDPVLKFLGKAQGSAAEFDASLATGRLAYPTQAVAVQMNLVDSHDTPRILTQVNGDTRRVLLAATFAMTYVGAPHVYYGDEVALEGGADPDCRRPMPWDWAADPKRKSVHDAYRQLIALRKAHAALRTGDFRTVLASGMTYAYLRGDGAETFLVVLNAGATDADVTLDTAALGGPATATDALAAGATQAWSGPVHVKVPAVGARVFQLARGK